MIRIAAQFAGRDQATDLFHDWWILRLPGLCERYDGRGLFSTYASDSLRRDCIERRRRNPRRLATLSGDVADDRRNPIDKTWHSDLRGEFTEPCGSFPRRNGIRSCWSTLKSYLAKIRTTPALFRRRC